MRILQLRPPNVDWLLRSSALFDDPAERTAARAYLRDPANLFLLAVEGSEAVGFLRGTSLRQPHTRRRQMFLYEIAVLPRAQRRGIARALIQRLVRYCRSRRFEEIFVFTSPNNRPAVRLYRSTGGVTETDADRMYVYRLTRARGGSRRSKKARRPGPGKRFSATRLESSRAPVV